KRCVAGLQHCWPTTLRVTLSVVIIERLSSSMLEEIVDRLKHGKLLESDYPAIVRALTNGEVVAFGAGSVAAGGAMVNSRVATFVFQTGQGNIEISEALLAKLNETV